jgi:hypothetical protein
MSNTGVVFLLLPAVCHCLVYPSSDRLSFSSDPPPCLARRSRRHYRLNAPTHHQPVAGPPPPPHPPSTKLLWSEISSQLTATESRNSNFDTVPSSPSPALNRHSVRRRSPAATSHRPRPLPPSPASSSLFPPLKSERRQRCSSFKHRH